MIIWIQKAIGFAALITLAALGELLTEKSGGLNLGTPGTMCVGAATGFIAAFRYCQAVEEPSV
ncbi:MAG: ABC transporter permease, partial [Clostridia bacterium]|nr:ABC transporter permease [Clostridia bacterium]